MIALRYDNGFVPEVTSGQQAGVLLDQTCFYAEAGGQIYDIGFISKIDDDVSAKRKFGNFHIIREHTVLFLLYNAAIGNFNLSLSPSSFSVSLFLLPPPPLSLSSLSLSPLEHWVCSEGYPGERGLCTPCWVSGGLSEGGRQSHLHHRWGEWDVVIWLCERI